jgi:formylglycine-generating enzyme required for sulfatase activity/dienelactone hydrolase/predicted Ser/Thr protein kinase
MIGKTLGHYQITEKLGQGGMGEVFLADDLSLGRKVALKFLPPEMQQDDIAHKRFVREARSAAALDHPYICSIHEVGEFEGKDFIVMEYVDGQTLAEKLSHGQLPLKEALRLAEEVAEALEQAHDRGVIHRDLKPSNIMLTKRGHVKVMDFGLAKQLHEMEKATRSEDTLTALTREGSTLGTLAYMSPEQLRGQIIEARSDVFSFGVVFYEMLTGVHPFRESSPMDTAAGILTKEPVPLERYVENTPGLLQETVRRMLAKDVTGRYANIKEVRADLGRLMAQIDQAERGSLPLEARGLWKTLGRPAFVIPGLILIVVLGYLAATEIVRNHKIRWAREVALPKAQRLVAEDDWAAAYPLAVEAEKYIPADPQLREVFADVAVLFSAKTDPPDAQVFLKPYAAANMQWEFIGRTPLEARRVSRGFKEFRITKDGYDAITGFTGTNQRFPPALGVRILLERTLAIAGTTPSDMVRVDGGKYKPTIDYFRRQDEVELDAFLIDRFETSNSQYQAFVDAGGYREKKYWKQAFVRDGKVIPWEEAIAGFTDKTGRKGPANWELGNFPEGQADYPVSGISWYEAAAYAEFAGKSLPTFYHWNRAAGVYDAGNTSMIQPIVMNSNFGYSGPARLGRFAGISPYGAFDMAGNVREWIWNGAPRGRYLLGGSWGMPEYLFFETPDLLSPFDRNSANGFRCVKLAGKWPLPPAAIADVPVGGPNVDFIFPKPVSDEVFKIYLGYYSYDKTALDPAVEALDETSSHYVRQRITFKAAYGNERVPVYLFFPKNAKPPFQTVLIFPGSAAQFVNSIDAYASINVAMFTRSGRAVAFPSYRGTFERTRPDTSTPTLAREYTISLYKDLARTIDYLETRPEFDCGKLAYFGLSWGGELAPIFGALEKRIRVFVLEAGGLVRSELPEIAPVNFAPRLTAPTVIFNGRYDLAFPVEKSAKPLLELLGTPKQDKALVLFDAGHLPPLDSKLQREMLDWLDNYLGPVQ